MKIFLSVFLVLIVGLSFYTPSVIVENEVLLNAGSAFALAKGLNMVVSVLQGTELSVTPFGLGLNLSIGEVLDPFNDMIERFSIVMLASVISLGIQELILELSSKMFLQYLFVVSVVLTLVYIWTPKLQNNYSFSIIIKTFLFLLVLRFAALFFMFASTYFYTSVQHTKYTAYSMDINTTKNKLDAINQENKATKENSIEKRNTSTSDSSGWYTGMKDYFVESTNDLQQKFTESQTEYNMSKQLDNLKGDIEKTSNTIIEVMTIFIVQTIIFPLLFLWFFIYLVKTIFNIKFNYDSISQILK